VHNDAIASCLFVTAKQQELTNCRAVSVPRATLASFPFHSFLFRRRLPHPALYNTAQAFVLVIAYSCHNLESIRRGSPITKPSGQDTLKYPLDTFGGTSRVVEEL
jgi:hypothetical protein